MTPSDQVPEAGATVGSLIGTGFGLVFIEVNGAHLPGPAVGVTRVAGAVIAVVLIALIAAASRTSRTGSPPGERAGLFGRGYWITVMLEAAALVAGLTVINTVLHHSQVAVAWVALVVGIHFFGLAHAWRLPRFTALGAVMALLGIAGFVLDAAGGTHALIALVSGIGSGLALFIMVAAALWADTRKVMEPDRDRWQPPR
jgi:hypothetical protein